MRKITNNPWRLKLGHWIEHYPTECHLFKRATLYSMALLIGFSIVSCGVPSESSSSNSSPTTGSSSSDNGSASDTFVYAINAGASDVATLNGVEYSADRFATGGTPQVIDRPIAGVTEDAVYQSERYGTFSYEIPVSDATYTVVLNFAELYQQQAGARSFNVTVEGKSVLSNVDLFQLVGGDTAYDYTVKNVAVADGRLSIAFSTLVDNATISGLVIYSNDGGEFIEPPAPDTSIPFANLYDGNRNSTVSFDEGWKFYLGDQSGAQNTSFNDSGWKSINVPHDWSVTLPFNQFSEAGSGGGYLDGGLGWYRKTFNLSQSSAEKKLFIQFDGVYMDSTVWLNGQQVCARPYGYTSFECDITSQAIVGGNNVLAVKVNNKLPSSRWYSGSGIYRHVWLKTVDSVRVGFTGTFVTTPTVSASSADVDISVVVQNDSGGTKVVTVENVVLDANGDEVERAASTSTTVSNNQSSEVKQSLTLTNPLLWSPKYPILYSVVTTLTVDGQVVDTYTTPFGVREFHLDANSGFWLNGEPLKLNGVCLHHDLGALGAATNTRAIEKRLELLKLMGTNAIRTSHNPPSPEFLDLADRMGFLIMDEAFDMWYAAKTKNDYARFFNQWSERDIKDFVKRDRNHPSVIMWSIGNEVPQAGDQNAASRLINFIRSLDTTRLVGQAFAQFAYSESTAGLEDFVGLNYNPGIYDSQHAKYPTRKFLGSETSSAIRSRGIYNKNNTQCSSYDDHIVGWGQTAENSWRDVNTRDWIAGEFIWTGFDYIGEPTPYDWPAKSSYFGAIDTANFPKDIFYFYQSRWNWDGPTMVHLVPMDWTNWTPGRGVRVLVYSNADSVELFLNGSSLGSKTVSRTQAKLEWSVPFATGKLEARASKSGTVVATDVVQTAGSAAKLQASVDRTKVIADGRDLAFVEVSVQDAQDVIVPNASNRVNFVVEGPGVLVGVDDGNAINHDSYKGNSHAAFSGKVMAIIQTTKSAGQITVRVSSNGLTGTAVNFESIP